MSRDKQKNRAVRAAKKADNNAYVCHIIFTRK